MSAWDPYWSADQKWVSGAKQLNAMSERLEAGCIESPILDLSLLRMNQFRPQPHIAHQSRREKLRAQASSFAPQGGYQSDTSGFSDFSNIHQPSPSITNQRLHQAQQTSEITTSARGYSAHPTEIGGEMQAYDTDHIMTSEMHNLPSGIELLGFPSKNPFLQAASGGDVASRPAMMGISYQSLGNPGATSVGNWKSLDGQENGSNSGWAPGIIASNTIQGFPSSGYGAQNISNPMPIAAPTSANMLHDTHSTNGMVTQGFESQKNFAEVPLHFPTFTQNALSIVSEGNPSSQTVTESTQTQWQSCGSDLPGNGNLQHNQQFIFPQFNNALNWANRHGGSQSAAHWSREPFVENKVDEALTEYVSSGADVSGKGLSLSLSSHQPSEIHLQGVAHHTNVLHMGGDGKAIKSGNLQGADHGIGYFPSYSRDGMAGKGFLNSIQAGGRPTMHMNAGSLGPLAGYGGGLKNSMYLKAAQELLYEFCNVGRGIKSNINTPRHKPPRSTEVSGKIETGMNQALYSGDRFELQRRKTKLLSMLEEVCNFTSATGLSLNPFQQVSSPRTIVGAQIPPDRQSAQLFLLVLYYCSRSLNTNSPNKYLKPMVDRRYKHYCDQMRLVVTSFESVTTPGAAAPYTALALKAMSRHFRCLRDAIIGQLESTSKALGEKDSIIPGTTRGETPRLGFLDRTIRQQRAFQQLGMMEQHPWRPQRGLPERSVSVLRAWLFEHFLHPYPTDADKHILARQTGLTRSQDIRSEWNSKSIELLLQVSNWFINARVRLWKPMVEEMYMEEIKEDKMEVTTVKFEQNDQEKEKSERPTGALNIDEKSDNQSASEEATFKLDQSCSTTSQTAQESSANMTLHLQSQQTIDNMKEAGMNLIRESESLSSMNNTSDQADKNYEQDKRLRNELYTNKLQATDTEIALDFSSYNSNAGSTVTYVHEDLTPRQFSSNGVSLTLGLRHSGGLSFPMGDQQKYSNNLYFSREQDDDPNNVQYNMLDSHDSPAGNGFIEQNLQFRNYVNGSRLLHDFVGKLASMVQLAELIFSLTLHNFMYIKLCG
eukprot:Gb_23074 [translate_table: standard]